MVTMPLVPALGGRSRQISELEDRQLYIRVPGQPELSRKLLSINK